MQINASQPVVQEEKNVQKSSIIFFVGSLITTISIFLPYVYQIIYLTDSTMNYNLFTVLTRESGGVRDDHPAGLFGIFPIVILLLSLACICIGGYEIYKKQYLPKAIMKKIFPVTILFLLLLFDFVGMITYKNTLHELIDKVNEIVGMDVGSYGRGWGFYLIYIGIAICIISSFLSDKMDS